MGLCVSKPRANHARGLETLSVRRDDPWRDRATWDSPALQGLGKRSLPSRGGEGGNRELVPLGPPPPTPSGKLRLPRPRKGEGSRTRAATARFICDCPAAPTPLITSY